MNKENQKILWNIIILVSIFCIVLSIMFLVSEMLEARDYCDSIQGEYNVVNFKHICDNEVLVNTKDFGWLKESEVPNFKVEIK